MNQTVWGISVAAICPDMCGIRINGKLSPKSAVSRTPSRWLFEPGACDEGKLKSRAPVVCLRIARDQFSPRGHGRSAAVPMGPVGAIGFTSAANAVRSLSALSRVAVFPPALRSRCDEIDLVPRRPWMSASSLPHQHCSEAFPRDSKGVDCKPCDRAREELICVDDEQQVSVVQAARAARVLVRRVGTRIARHRILGRKGPVTSLGRTHAIEPILQDPKTKMVIR